MNKYILVLLMLLSSILSFSQDFEKAVNLLDDRLKNIEDETRKLTEDNFSLSQNLANIQKQLSREKKRSKRLEKQLDEALTQLYDNKHKMDLKILEANMLRSNIDLLLQDNKNLSLQVTKLDSSKSHLVEELNLNKKKIQEMDSLYSEELKKARTKSAYTNLKYPFGRPNPTKSLLSGYYDPLVDFGARVSWEKKRTQIGLSTGYSNLIGKISGYDDNYFSYINAGINVKCFKGFRESVQEYLGNNVNQFLNFELGGIPYSFNRNNNIEAVSGIIYSHIGGGVAFAWDKNKIISISTGFKILNYNRTISDEVKQSKVASRGYLRLEITFW